MFDMLLYFTPFTEPEITWSLAILIKERKKGLKFKDDIHLN